MEHTMDGQSDSAVKGTNALLKHLNAGVPVR